MKEQFTSTQNQRLVELNEIDDFLNMEFDTVKERNNWFKKEETRLVKENKEKISKLLKVEHKTLSLRIESDLEKWLMEEGFTRVVTPIIITASMLEKMTITKEHPLTNQVFWLDGKKCLRPMLAPNLYKVMGDLRKITKEPVRIFESGSCFRKESQGAQHMNEFKMLNFVEVAGVEKGEQMDRLVEMARKAMAVVGIENYQLVEEGSEVYGKTLDIVCDGIEMASGAYGPHLLDEKWGIFDTWVGIGFGIERIAMAKNRYKTIKRVGGSIAYLDGSPLNL